MVKSVANVMCNILSGPGEVHLRAMLIQYNNTRNSKNKKKMAIARKNNCNPEFIPANIGSL